MALARPSWAGGSTKGHRHSEGIESARSRVNARSTSAHEVAATMSGAVVEAQQSLDTRRFEAFTMTARVEAEMADLLEADGEHVLDLPAGSLDQLRELQAPGMRPQPRSQARPSPRAGLPQYHPHPPAMLRPRGLSPCPAVSLPTT